MSVASPLVADLIDQAHTLPVAVGKINSSFSDFCRISVESVGQSDIVFIDSVLFQRGTRELADIKIARAQILPIGVVAQDVVGREVKTDGVDVPFDPFFAEDAR